jgi:hypothetical protein
LVVARKKAPLCKKELSKAMPSCYLHSGKLTATREALRRPLIVVRGKLDKRGGALRLSLRRSRHLSCGDTITLADLIGKGVLPFPDFGGHGMAAKEDISR